MSTERIHPTAIVHPEAVVAGDVRIGPYTLVGRGVRIGEGTVIGPHVDLRGPLELGLACVVEFGCALGHEPQVRDDDGPFGHVRIGARNVFREQCQVHRSRDAAGATVVGDDGYFMAQCHVGHDCRIGDRVTVCNHVLLAGHVDVGDGATLGGAAAVHQFCRIGTLAMVGGMAAVRQDVPPFGMVAGNRPCELSGLNAVGLRRAGVSAGSRRALASAYRTLFPPERPLEEALASLPDAPDEVAHLREFVRSSRRGVIGVAVRRSPRESGSGTRSWMDAGAAD